jgi:23S rRNA (pseudouridine1915-N3)-methyltransferase
MIFHLIAVGSRMPLWVNQGFKNYQKRLPPEYKLDLIVIAPSKRSKNHTISRLLKEEGEKISAAIPKQSRSIALDRKGQMWNTQQLAENLQQCQLERQNISLLIGGPDGLSESCLNNAKHIWSLSPLTLPHPLVRIIVIEQLYRAWSLLKGHPYHRE